MKPLSVYNSVTAPQSAREQEAIAFRLAARRLREAADRQARNRALRINHELWSLMLRDLGGSKNELPPILKNDCLSLARFSTDYSTRAVLKPELPLQPLIEVNERVAEGLDSRAEPAALTRERMPLLASA